MLRVGTVNLIEQSGKNEIRRNQIEIGKSFAHPTIYLPPSENIVKDLERLKLEIRKSDNKLLASSVYNGCHCVQTIKEFEIVTKIFSSKEEEDDLDIFSDSITNVEESSEQYWDIPDGVPSLLNLISSIPLAFKTQASN